MKEATSPAQETEEGKRQAKPQKQQPGSGFLPGGTAALTLRAVLLVLAGQREDWGISSRSTFSPRALTFSTFYSLGRLSRVCAIILFSCFSAIFKRGVVSLSGGNGVI